MNDEKTRNSYGDAKVILYFRFQLRGEKCLGTIEGSACHYSN